MEEELETDYAPILPKASYNLTCILPEAYQQMQAQIAELERLRPYVSILEQAVEYARNQQERDFMLLLPELDFRRLAVYGEQERER